MVGGKLSGEVGIDGRSVVGWPMYRMAEEVVTGVQDPAGQLSLIAETVAEEVAFGPANLGLPREDIEDRVEEAVRVAAEQAHAAAEQDEAVAPLAVRRQRWDRVDTPFREV